MQSSDTAELLEKLEDAQMALGSMASSRFGAPFRNDISTWLGKLGIISEQVSSTHLTTSHRSTKPEPGLLLVLRKELPLLCKLLASRGVHVMCRWNNGWRSKICGCTWRQYSQVVTLWDNYPSKPSASKTSTRTSWRSVLASWFGIAFFAQSK